MDSLIANPKERRSVMSEPTSGSSPSNSSRLPPNPSAEYLRKLAKDRLREMRQTAPAARLFEAQLAVAREHGFGNWRELIAQLNAGQRGKVKRSNGRVEIEGVAPLAWCGSDCTYLAALANVLKVIGPAHDYVRLFGDSGLAFRVRWWTNDAATAGCPSSPVGEMMPWMLMTERSIGWTMRSEFRMKECPDDRNDLPDQLDQVTASIDAGLPVLGYFKKWDVGIAYGYEGSRLLVRDYWMSGPDALIEIGDCPGYLNFFEQRSAVPAAAESARVALAEGVSRWSHAPDRTDRNGSEGAYYYGREAYERWTTLLESADHFTPEQLKGLLHVSYWTFISLHDARQKAAPYLRSIADLFPESAPAIKQAAGIYQQIGEMTGQVIHDGEIFPAFYAPGALEKWTPNVRRREIELLNRMGELDQQAIALLSPSFRSSSSPG
jgi:hypothetical protein